MLGYTVKVDVAETIWWYLNDKLHREDGPAAEWVNGTKCWYLNDKLHREDGPAVEYANGTKHWYINGKELTKEQFNSRNTKELTVAEIEKLLGYSVKIVNDKHMHKNSNY